jgi:hypothetical protein
MNRLLVPLLTALAAGLSCKPAGPPPPTQWTRVRCPLATRTAKERFETTRLLQSFEEGQGGWTAVEGEQQAKAKAAVSTENAHDGQAALRVDYAFVGKADLEYVEILGEGKIETKGLGVGLWVKGNGAPLQVRVRVKDTSGETHQLDLARLDFTGWRFAAAKLDQRGGSWGGDGNKRLDLPCTLHSIALDRPQRGYKGTGTVWLDAVQVVKPRKAEEAMSLDIAGRRVGNIYEPGDTVRLLASGPGEAIRWRAENFWGQTVVEGEGSAAAERIEFELPTAGWFACTIERVAGERVAERRVFRCAALPPPEEPRNSFIGIGTHFRHLQYPLECFDLLARLGITQIRDEISWSAMERKKGELEMPDWGEAWTARAAELGIEPLLIFDYANRLYDAGGFPTSDEAVAAFARYAAAQARMLQDRVRHFEVWNEYSIGTGMGGRRGVQTPQMYARMLEATYQAVKEAVPGATVVGIGGEHSGHHVEFI